MTEAEMRSRCRSIDEVNGVIGRTKRYSCRCVDRQTGEVAYLTLYQGGKNILTPKKDKRYESLYASDIVWRMCQVYRICRAYDRFQMLCDGEKMDGFCLRRGVNE